MIVTEDRALNLQCCGPNGCGTPGPRPEWNAGTENAKRYCIGFDCMAWRWFDGVNDDSTKCTPAPSIHVARSPDKERDLEERRGYCGLAGKP